MNFKEGKIMLLSSSTSSGEMRCVYDCKIAEHEKGVTIEYDEGEERKAITKINIFEKGITVKKDGDMKSLMLFEIGKKNKTSIVTEYGELNIKIYTNDIDVKKIGNKLTIYIDYDIYYVRNAKDNTRLNINCLIKEKERINLEDNI